MLSTRARSSRSRARAGLGSRAPGPDGAGGAELPEAQLARKGALGLGGEEFALLVIGEKDRDCSRSERGFTNDKDHTRSSK